MKTEEQIREKLSELREELEDARIKFEQAYEKGSRPEDPEDHQRAHFQQMRVLREKIDVFQWVLSDWLV